MALTNLSSKSLLNVYASLTRRIRDLEERDWENDDVRELGIGTVRAQRDAVEAELLGRTSR